MATQEKSMTGKASSATQQARETAAEAAGSAQQEAKGVAQEATTQARQLAEDVRGQMSRQADTQRERLINSIRSFGDDLATMATSADRTGPATDLVQQAAGRIRDLADAMERREPSDMLNDLRTYARQHPAAFLTAAGAAGVVMGRLTRGAKAAASQPDRADRAEFVDLRESTPTTPMTSPTRSPMASADPMAADPMAAPADPLAQPSQYDRYGS